MPTSNKLQETTDTTLTQKIVPILILFAIVLLALAAGAWLDILSPGYGVLIIFLAAGAAVAGRLSGKDRATPLATIQPDDMPSTPESPPVPAVPESPAQLLEPANNITIYRELVENSVDGHIILLNGNVEFISNSGVALLGWDDDAASMLGQPLQSFLPENARKNVTTILEKVTQTGQANRVMVTSSVAYLEFICTPFVQYAPTAIHILMKDITAQKRMEAELTERNRELTILQSAGVSISSRLDLRYVLDTVAQEMVRLLSVSQCSIFEWNTDENVIHQNAAFGPDGWWDPKSEPRTYPLAKFPLTRAVLEDEIPEQMRINQPTIDPYEQADMTQLQVKSRLLVPMAYQRKILGLVRLDDGLNERTFTFQEISLAKLLAGQAASAVENARLFEQAQEEIVVRKHTEAELEKERALLAERVKERTAELSRANAELARAARLKDEFLAGMSHELRTPLNTVLGSVEILQAGVFGELAEQQRKYLANIDESGRHLLSLINDILDLSKIEAGKMEINIEPTSVFSVTQASLRMVKQLAHKKRLQLKDSVQAAVSIFPADERRVKQVLVNLLSNAIKFTPDGGEVGLDVTDDVERGVIEFSVWDTGIGIAKEDLARLFEPFVQLDSRLARQHTGTGLGLSLVVKMVELHGGGVTVDSEVGKGSRFTATFPLASLSEADDGETPVRSAEMIIPEFPPDATPPLILLAEDNEQSIQLFSDYLTAHNFRLTVARNGLEAISRVREEKPEIILMDVQMPEMDGLEAMRQLRADDRFADIPIIAMTALAMPGDRERCIEAGASDYLSKPVNLRQMVQTITQYLNV